MKVFELCSLLEQAQALGAGNAEIDVNSPFLSEVQRVVRDVFERTAKLQALNDSILVGDIERTNKGLEELARREFYA